MINIKTIREAYRNCFSYYTIRHFNYVFKKAILERAKDKKSVGLYLSGGKDTRSILSVLLGNDIKVSGAICIDFTDEDIQDAIYKFNMPDWRIAGFIERYRKDFMISSKICKSFDIPVIKVSGVIEQDELIKKGCFGMDIVFSGYLMTEILDIGTYRKPFSRVVRFVDESIDITNRFPSVCMPMLDRRVLTASGFIPFYFKRNGLIGVKMIEWNFPSLLDFPLHKQERITKKSCSKIVVGS